MKLEELPKSLASLLPSGRELSRELEERIERIPADLNGFGYDPWGFNPEVLAATMLPSLFMYRNYFRCVTKGVENIPAGSMLLIGNHGGQVALDGLMVMTAMIMEAEPPRLARGMGEYWLATLPWLSALVERLGSSIGTPKTCIDMLGRGQCVLAFPEGVRGMNKVYADAYQLQDFGLGFMRLALASRSPIVPFSVVGSEEQAPAIANLSSLGNMLGMPAFPITLTWPLLGPLGLIPLPARYHIEFGPPMHFTGNANDENEVIEEMVAEVKDTIQTMVRRGLAERESIFF